MNIYIYILYIYIYVYHKAIIRHIYVYVYGPCYVKKNCYLSIMLIKCNYYIEIMLE